MLCIIGCGNPTRSDDGVGVYVAQQLQAQLPAQTRVRVYDTGTNGMEVMFKARGGFWVSTSNVHSSAGLFVDANNNVGIGTDSPGARLQVNGDILIGYDNIIKTGGYDAFYWSSAYGAVAAGAQNAAHLALFAGAAAPRIYVKSDTGNVGVNTTSPVSRLQINGDVGLGDGTPPNNYPVVIWLNAYVAVNSGDVVVAGPNDNQFNTT
ncbi:MAG: hydrogenase maturation protease, partial [Nevskia sp.]|nr:hydrogenase maturation protease [Nevskia sp.]